MVRHPGGGGTRLMARLRARQGPPIPGDHPFGLHGRQSGAGLRGDPDRARRAEDRARPGRRQVQRAEAVRERLMDSVASHPFRPIGDASDMAPRRRRRTPLAPYLFLVPALAILLIVSVYPLAF